MPLFFKLYTTKNRKRVSAMRQNEQAKLFDNFLKILETSPSVLGFECGEDDFIEASELIDLIGSILSDDYNFILHEIKELEKTLGYSDRYAIENYIKWRKHGEPFCEQTLTYLSQLNYNKADDILKLTQFGYNFRDLVKADDILDGSFLYLISLMDKGVKVDMDDLSELFTIVSIYDADEVYKAVSLAGSVNEALNSNGIPNIKELKAEMKLPTSVDMSWYGLKMCYNHPKLKLMDYLEYKTSLGEYNAIKTIGVTIEIFEENNVHLSLLEGAPDYQDFICENRLIFVEASQTRPAIIECFQQYSYLNLPSETLKAVLDEMLKAL